MLQLIGRLLVLALLTALGAGSVALCASAHPGQRIAGAVGVAACLAAMIAVAVSAVKDARRRANPTRVDQTAEEYHD